jgi:glutamyl-tRNA synthetase
MRSALTGNNVSPGISEVLEWLGKTESLGRINDQI